jgi:uncharacterized protein YbcI
MNFDNRIAEISYIKFLLMKKAIVHDITGVKVLSLHYDISAVTGEDVVLFNLAASPLFRET